MAAHLIPNTAIEQYARGPSDSTVAAAKSLHENIRTVLGDRYETFLQGSYRNNTGVADLNDVDIVAIRKGTTSGVFSTSTGRNPISWDRIFQEVQGTLEGSHHYRGKTERRDKCITINTNFKADVVPAVEIVSTLSDPIAIYSFRERAERKNYPRDHYENNTKKHDRTNEAYKPTVRMFKRWTRNWFGGTDVAPSFYVECLVHWVPNDKFDDDLAYSFFFVASHIVLEVSRSTYIGSVAGDKDILVSTEWDWDQFSVFQRRLLSSCSIVGNALKATSESEARRLWRTAFNE